MIFLIKIQGIIFKVKFMNYILYMGKRQQEYIKEKNVSLSFRIL